MREPLAKLRVKELFKSHRPYVKHFMPVQGGYGAATLDFINCCYGVYVAVETKSTGKKMTERQEVTAKEIERAGGKVFRDVSEQEDIDAIATYLNILRLHNKPLCDARIAEVDSNASPSIQGTSEVSPTVVKKGTRSRTRK